MKRTTPTAGILLLVLGFTTVISSALASCPERVTQALTVAREVCDGTGRNEACYGHELLEAQPASGVRDLVFNEPGHQVDVALLRSLRLMPMDEVSDLWGVALMRLQANLPATAPQHVTLLLFGDVSIENAAPPPTRADVTVISAQAANVRAAAEPDAGVIGTLQPGQTVTAVARVADSSWLRVQIPDTGEVGWVFAPLLRGDQAAIDALNVDTPREPYYAPMQAFYFQSGQDNPACEQASNGLLVQTPEGVGKVRLWMNEVRLQIGSTVFFQAQPGGDMVIQTLEGAALVEAMGVTQNAVAGTQVRVPLTEDMRPAAPPSVPEPYDGAAAQALPVAALDEPIEIAEPLTQQEIIELLAPQQCCDAPGTETTTTADSQNCTGDCNGRPDCPGNSCDAPGHGGDNPGVGRSDCPGNSCNAPGQNKDKDQGGGRGGGGGGNDDDDDD